MGRQRDIRRNSGVWPARWMHSTTLLLGISLFFMWVGQAVADENNRRPTAPTMLESEPSLHGVGDDELAAIYGKGYQPPLWYVQERLAVILWDEGKRKLPSNEAMAVLTQCHIDIHRSAAKRSQ